MEDLSNCVDSFFNAIADPAFILDERGGIVNANPVALMTFPDVKVGDALDDLARTLAWSRAKAGLGRCLEKGETVFEVLKGETGRPRFEITCIPVRLACEETSAVLLCVANVMGESLRDERFCVLNRVFESITEGVLILDLKRRIIGMNRSATGLLGVEEKEVKLKPFGEIVRFKYRKERVQFQKAFDRRVRLEIHTVLILPSGRELPCSLSMSLLKEQEDLFSGFTVILRDRTAQIRMEHHLIQMEKLNSLGNLVAGFAHELNNPLTSVIGFAQLLQTTHKDDSIREEMGVIHRHAVRCKKIVDNLLAFARERIPEKKLIDVNSVVRSTFDLMRCQLERNRIRFRMNLDRSLPMIRADDSQVQQVLVNLIENARFELNQMEKGGTITVTTEQTAQWVHLRVADNGPGIPEEVMNRIFDPFFTTKPPGRGTGLGLSLTFGIVQEHEGTLTVQNLTAGGAEFLIKLPLCSEAMRVDGVETEEADWEHPWSGPDKRILVVDDEKDICSLLSSFFSRKGLRVNTALSGREAKVKLDSEKFDLLLLDIRLPDADGVELGNEIVRCRPEYQDRIFFITGDALEVEGAGNTLRIGNERGVITKPFNMHLLWKQVSEALAAHFVQANRKSMA